MVSGADVIPEKTRALGDMRQSQCDSVDKSAGREKAVHGVAFRGKAEK